jgi:spore photoproduct lyase
VGTYKLRFEIISHRFTTIAKNRILQIFPESDLPMDEEQRKFKYGQFGYGKYVYPKEIIDEIRQFFIQDIEELFSNKEVKYII